MGYCVPGALYGTKRIVAKLDNLSTKTKKLETAYQKKIAELDELKKIHPEKSV